MATDPRLRGHLSFSIDARHVRQLGRELVGNRVTAVSELIKNAYDADATTVEVSFSPEARRGPGGVLVVKDDGIGMTLDEIAQRWMVISTSYKDAASISELYRRRRAGQKGIGRFAAETLGGRLVLSSTVRNQSQRVVVEFDWEAEYLAGTRLDQVANAYHVEDAPSEEHGTELRIETLHQSWDDRMLQRVREAVFLLQPPFRVAEIEGPGAPSGLAVDPGFRVVVRYADHEPDLSAPGDVDEVLDAATAWISGEVGADGAAVRLLESPHLGIRDENNPDDRLLLAGPFSFQVAYFIFRRDALNPDSSVGVRRAQALADRFGGIRLYRDGLRILPYGEPGNDWLGLDAIYRQRGQVLAPIGNTNFFGEVLISREDNVLLVDTASREGVVENEAFEELRDYVLNALVWAVNGVAAVRKRKLRAGGPISSPASRRELLNPLVTKARAVAEAGSQDDRQTALVDLLQEAQRAHAEAGRSDQQEKIEREHLVDEISLMRVLASLGGSIAVFSHEVRTVLTQARGALGDLTEAVAGLDPKAPFSEFEEAERNLESLSDLASYLDLYISHSGRRRREPQAVHRVVASFAKTLSRLLDRRGVEIETDVRPPHLRTALMSRSELEAVLFNFMTNSLKALDSEGLESRRIRIEGREEGGDVLLRFLDTGVGIPPTIRDRVFDAFVTTTEASEAELGMGTGLGLKIVADIAEANGGSASVGSPEPPFVTCMELRLPAWASEEGTDDNENEMGGNSASTRRAGR